VHNLFVGEPVLSGSPGSSGGAPVDAVVVEPGCFLSLAASAIEAYDRETNGFLVGSGNSRRAVLSAAYPLQTEERKRNWVAHGNLRAFDRARRTVEQMYVGLDLLGGFHSHTGADGAASLSRWDLDYIEEELRRINGKTRSLAQDRWLELVIAIRRREYRRPPGFTWSLRRYKRKVGATVVLRPGVGFDLTLGAYWVRVGPNGSPGSIEIAGKDEVPVRLPWSDSLRLTGTLQSAG